MAQRHHDLQARFELIIGKQPRASEDSVKFRLSKYLVPQMGKILAFMMVLQVPEALMALESKLGPRLDDIAGYPLAHSKQRLLRTMSISHLNYTFPYRGSYPLSPNADCPRHLLRQVEVANTSKKPVQ